MRVCSLTSNLDTLCTAGTSNIRPSSHQSHLLKRPASNLSIRSLGRFFQSLTFTSLMIIRQHNSTRDTGIIVTPVCASIASFSVNKLFSNEEDHIQFPK